MAAKTVAEVIVERLANAGVKRIYGVAGDSLNGITDVIRRRTEVQWIHVRHEETAAFAAAAEAHLTGQVTACAGSCGPGNLHLINGLFDAHRSRLPVVVIAAQIPSQEIGSGFFQETHPEHLFKECSHYCELVSHTDQIPRVLDIAIQTARSLRGVSVVVLPGNIALSHATGSEQSGTRSEQHPEIRPSEAELTALARMLNGARKITILGGAGCAGAHAELMTVAGMLQSPIVHALRGKEFIEYDNAFDVGMTGLLGVSSGYAAMMDCDMLLMLGTDFPYHQFYPEKATVAQVDIRGEQLARRTKVDLGLVGDVKQTLAALIPRLEQKTDDDHLKKSLNHYRQARQTLDDMGTGEPGHTPIHPQYVAKLVNELAADDAVFTCDVGMPTVWAARYLTMNGKRRLLGSFVHGSMAGAVPQAIGAQLSHPGRQVVTLSGDGGLAMLMGDILSLHQHGLPVKIVVFNNGSLGLVEMEMQAAGFLDFATELRNPDFAKIADASGILGISVELPEQLRPALERAFGHDGPALVSVKVSRHELAMPSSVSMAQVVGFNLYMMKAVLSGRADEIVDLAKVNLFR